MQKPVVVQVNEPAPIKPVAPKDRALVDTFMADMTRRSILDRKRAA